MTGQPVAVLMARESARRNLVTASSAAPSRRRRGAARALQLAAHRLDPQVAAPRAALAR